jgi:hypothetical protein
MSVARVTTVAKARKAQRPCGKCRKEIKVGDPYLHFAVGFRGYKQVRCTDTACYPKVSERESSKIATIYAAQEDIDFSQLTDRDDIVAEVNQLADVIREIADEYREASTDDNGTVFNVDAEERADILDSAADECDSWEPSEEVEPCEAHTDKPDDTCDACIEAEDVLERIRSEADDFINGLELP